MFKSLNVRPTIYKYGFSHTIAKLLRITKVTLDSLYSQGQDASLVPNVRRCLISSCLSAGIEKQRSLIISQTVFNKITIFSSELFSMAAR